MKGKDFISKATDKNEGRFIYHVKDDEEVFYRHEVKMECVEHKEVFKQNVGNHLSGKVGCPICITKRKAKAKALTQCQFEQRTREAGFPEELWDLSKAVYVNNSTNVEITCKKHNNTFLQIPATVFRGQNGCVKCVEEKHGIKRERTLDDALNDVKCLLDEYLDFSLIYSYEGYEQEVDVVCKKHHTKHKTKWKYLFKGKTPCPVCKPERISRGQIDKVTLEDYIKSIPEDNRRSLANFDLSKVSYIGTKTPVPVRCIKHNLWFEQTLYSIYKGHNNCPQCIKDNLSLGGEEFVKRSEQTWGVNRYDYSNVKYINYNTPVEIRCIEHDNTFWQAPENHSLGSQGCRKCDMVGQSKAEHEIIEFLKGLNVEIKHGDRKIIRPLEIDILVKSAKLAVEYNGTYFHSDVMKERSYHLDKQKLVAEAGYNLFTIWEYDWNNPIKKEIIKKILANKIGKSSANKVNARSCNFVNVDKNSADEFFNENHIQGRAGGGYSYSFGLTYEDEIVALMSFKKNKENWDLVRYATSCNVRGGASKLFKYSLKNLPDGDVISFSDIQMFNGGLYEKLGFVEDKVLPPDYKVFHQKTGIQHKSYWRRKMIPKRLVEIGKEYLNFIPSTDERTEWVIQDAVKAFRLWDCGKVRWVYKR